MKCPSFASGFPCLPVLFHQSFINLFFLNLSVCKHFSLIAPPLLSASSDVSNKLEFLRLNFLSLLCSEYAQSQHVDGACWRFLDVFYGL